MATINHGSPSQFVGQPWSSWAEKLVGRENTDALSSVQGDEADGALEVPDEDTDREQDKEQVMKLRIEDANVFGICPTQDEFYLVVCERCSQVVKPQALERHMELRHGKPPDKPPDIPCPMEIMHSPPIRIPITPRAPLCLQPQRSIPLGGYEDSHPTHSELSLPPRAASQPQASEMTFDTVLNKPLPVHLVQRPDSPNAYTTGRSRDDASSAVSGKLNSPLEIQDVLSNLVSPTLPVVRIERMSPQQANEVGMQSLGISPVSLASGQQTTIELVPVSSGSIQCAPNLVSQQPSQTLIQHQQPTKPVPTAMVQLAPGPTPMMQTVKPGLVQPPPIQPAPTGLVKLAPAQPVQAKRNKKLSPKKNILCKDREFDVNKHCGVWVDADRRQCTRSLTCKTHALSLRRAVKGRRKPFDELLAEHKARSQAQAAANNSSLLKRSTQHASSSSASSSVSNPAQHNATMPHGIARPSTPKTTPSRPSTPKALTPKVLTPKPQPVGNLHVKSEANSKPLTVYQKIMPVPGPSKTYNFNLVLPARKSHHAVTVLDSVPVESAANEGKARPADGGSTTSSSSQGRGSEEKTAKDDKDKSDYSCSHHHPRPVAMCSFGARQVGKGLYAFNRRLDHLRSTMAALVEKHSRPPPVKKLCLSSDSSQESTAAMDTTPPSRTSELQVNNSASHSAASSSAYSLSSASLFDNTRTSATTCSRSGSGTGTLSKTKSLPNAMCNNFNKGLATSKKLSGKTSAKCLNKSADGKVSASLHHPIKNSKARRKSGGGAGKSNAGLSGSIAQNLFSVSNASPVTLTGSSSYSIVTNSGLQPGDILGSGMVNLDPASIANPELSGNLLKNLRFVVTNIEPSVNGGAVGNAATPQTTGNFTVPILNATLGNTPVLLGNLGALALPYDRKLNVKSRTKSAGSGKSSVDKQGPRLSGSNTSASLQNVAILSQPFIDCSSAQDAVGTGAGLPGSERGNTVNTCQPLQSPQSVPSPQLRPNSASPQLTSPLPNGIIPSPTNITFKSYPSTTIAASANHVQRGMSPSRTSTPSPSTGSADASPNVTTQLLTGSFSTSGKLTLVSPKASSHNLQKSTLNQKHGHHHHPHRSAPSQQQQQQLQQPQHQQPQQQQQQQQQALQFHQLQLTPQQIQQQLQQQISSLVAMDPQGKPLSLSSALIPNLFQSIPTQQVGTGVLPGGLTLAPAVASEQGGKVLSQSTVLPQRAIALHLQQPGSGQPIRLQGAGLSDQSQIGMSQDEDNRQEIKMQH